jgi:hypothetical protein
MTTTTLTERHYRPNGGGAALPAAAERLRIAFAGHRGRAEVPHCPHCVSDDELRALAADPGSVPPALVGRFVRKAGTTWGDAEELRRLTPRILELAADHRLPISRAVVWRKLREARWQEWDRDEVEAIAGFLGAEWSRLLRAPARPAHAAHRWLAEVAGGVDDLSGFLTIWHDAMGPLPDPEVQAAAVAHLVELLTSSPLRPDLPATMADVFPGQPEAAAQVTRWLVGPGTAHELRRAAAAAAHTPAARRTNVAVERLRRFCAAIERGDAPPT